MILLDIPTQIEAISKISGSYTTWSLSIIGASVIAIVSTSYLRPTNSRIRKIYFLFIPGWLFLTFSMYHGDIILRSSAASAATIKEDLLLSIGEAINSAFDNQLTYFKWGIICFTLWLIIYLCWWVLGKWEIKK